MNSGGGYQLGPPHPFGGKGRRRPVCLEVLCQPSLLFLAGTIGMTVVASLLLLHSLRGAYWEILTYDTHKVNMLLETAPSAPSVDNSSSSSILHPSIKWLFEGRVGLVYLHPTHTLRYLLPLHSGIFISCIDLHEADFKELQEMGYQKNNKCVDHLDPQTPKPTNPQSSWQHRMQNLAIACAMVCLILLGAAVVVGLFGILRPQISAVLVTGVIYVLAALFALFTLTILHLKHKNRKDREALDVWTRLMPELGSGGGGEGGSSSGGGGGGQQVDHFRPARLISHGWSLQLAWAGTGVCILASIMWILLSKLLRYNPISLT